MGRPEFQSPRTKFRAAGVELGTSSRLLIAGVGPLPPDRPDKLFAPGLRVWGMARELARAGHEIRLATARFSGEPIQTLDIRQISYVPGTPEGWRQSAARLAPLPPSGNDPDAPGRIAGALAAEIEEFRPVALVGSTDLMGRELAAIATELPMWLDYFGDPMAERQMLARLHHTDAAISGQWRTLAPALARADRVSGCSRRQAGALLGELAAVGRLNRFTSDLDLSHLLRPWIEPIPPGEEPGPFVRGPVAPADAFLVLQTGGFNTWLDIDTLFQALEWAMDRRPEIHFAATGGAIPGHNELSFGRFRGLVEGSRHRGRFHFLGWLPLGRIPHVIAECDLGLNVDLPGAEGWLGTRNRLMDWLLGGLGVVSTRGCELAEDLEARFGEWGVVRIVPQRDAAAVAEAIERMALGRPETRKRAGDVRRALETEWAAERALAPLIEWARDPKPAPDLVAWREGRAEPPALWLAAARNADAQAALDRAREELARAQSRLKTLEGSSLVRAALKLRDALGRD